MAHPRKKHKNKVAKPSPHKRTGRDAKGGTPPRSADDGGLFDEPAPVEPSAADDEIEAERLNVSRLAQEITRMWEAAVAATAPPTSSSITDAQIFDLVQASVRIAANPKNSRRTLAASVMELTDLIWDDVDAQRRADLLIGDQIEKFLDRLWESGWQPLDVAHVVKRKLKILGWVFVSAMIRAEALSSGAAFRAPEEWLAQLDALPSTEEGGGIRGLTLPPGTPALAQFAMEIGSRPGDVWLEGIELIGVLGGLPTLPTLITPPSKWDAASRLRAATEAAGAGHGVGAGSKKPAGPSRGAENVRMLEKIRALLAKAESTDFAAEAEVFTAKAQDLMTRHSIDSAMVSGDPSVTDVHSRRIHLDDPYAEMKAQLVSAIADVNRARAIWDPRFGMVVIVGEPVDLELVELLFASLLIQATRAMTEAGSAGPDFRSPSFRRAFLLAYATRIGERLAEAGEHAVEEAIGQYGSALVPVLAGRAAAVDEEFDRMFPNVSRGRSRQVDAQGWNAGRSAADKAALGKPKSGGGGAKSIRGR